MGVPGPTPRGGKKSAHFGGYLIILPVGTKFALFLHFFGPPDLAPGRGSRGAIFGGALILSPKGAKIGIFADFGNFGQFMGPTEKPAEIAISAISAISRGLYR